jgi:prophage regulatory protein
MRYLSFSQLSQKLGGRSRSSLYRDIETGRLPPPLKLGGRRYWREIDVDRALERFASEED